MFMKDLQQRDVWIREFSSWVEKKESLFERDPLKRENSLDKTFEESERLLDASEILEKAYSRLIT